MEEILNELYSYEYFGIYLIISIVVLVLLFAIILFFGKKDQKEREKTATLKLQQINEDAFREESLAEKLEIENEKLENDTIIVPNINDIPSITSEQDNEIPEPVLPVQEELPQVEETEEIVEIKEAELPNQEVEPVSVEEKVEEVAPLLEKVEEKPLVFNEFNFESEKEIPVVPKIETPYENLIKPEIVKEEIEVPTFDFDEIVKGVEEVKKEQTYTKGPEIFSSVYVPKKEEVELPKVEVKEVKSIVEKDLEFELPTLKKVPEVEPVIQKEEIKEEVREEKIEMPVLNDYDLDNLSGETYTIK